MNFQKVFFICTILFSIIPFQYSSAQYPPRDVFNFIFENNYNDDQTGEYKSSDFQKDWNMLGGFNRLSEMDILSENDNKFMRGYFPQGTIGPDAGGWSWFSPLPSNLTEVYFSYDIRFKPGFNWVHGGKIPGVTGGRVYSGNEIKYTDGFSVRAMWKGYGTLVYYIYHQDQDNIYGSSYDWENFRFETGRWYNLTFRVVLNSVGSDGGIRNGILEGFVDGKLVFQKTDFNFRNFESIKIDRMYICSFFGGNDAIWNAARDEWIDTDNYLVYTYGNRILGVPRGHQASNYNKQLIHPYRSFSDYTWKTSFSYSTLSSSSLVLRWADYPVPSDYKLERKEEGSATFATIATLPYGTTSYTESDLSPSIVYTYRITAGNSVREIFASPQMTAPAAPTSLKSTAYSDKSISLCWNDNSENEESFVLTRTKACDPSSVEEITLAANETAYTDSNLLPQTTFIYALRAVNLKGTSVPSNKNVATTLSPAEMKRVRDGLIAYYNFGYNPDYIVYDQSACDEPINLRILDTTAVRWNRNNSMDILSNTALVSLKSASRIIAALKETNEVTFECWIKPVKPDFTSYSRIVSLANNDEDIGFILDQGYFDDSNDNRSLTYSVRMQTGSTIPSGYPEYQPSCSQTYLNVQHLVYVRNKSGYESLYLNGERSAEGYRPSDLSSWKEDYYLRLGNESDLDHLWKGSYYTVALYKRALSPAEILTNYKAFPAEKIRHGDVSYNLQISPNPATTFTNLKLTPEQSADYVVQPVVNIVNAYGEVLMRYPVFDPASQFEKTLDFSGYPNGIYFVQVISGNTQRSAKVIVQ